MEVDTPLRVIRAKCMDCSAQSFKEVRLCPVNLCPLWPYRMGSRPGTLKKKHPELLDIEWVKAQGEIEE